MKNFGIIIAIIVAITLLICINFAIAASDLPFWVKYLLLK